jgi:tRNA dimethylallyltransferase
MKNSPLITIVGPTASGKSALAMQIAEKYNGEIIAADSRTVYRSLDIGTAKPTPEDRRRIRHHLLDVRDPDQPFSAAEFKRLAEAAIADIHARGKLPILVGGTGLYVDAVIYDYQFGPVADPVLRARLNNMSVEELQEMCRGNDIIFPLNKQNKRHLIRAIELGGLLRHEHRLRNNTLVVGITTDRDILRQRIEHRARQMIDDGVLHEVAQVGQKYGWRGEALKGNIYRIFRGVVEGTQPLEEAIAEFVQSDMNLAKRQMTWFKRNKCIVWSKNPHDLVETVDTFLCHQ